MVKSDRIKTEVGIIPEDWKTSKVEAIADVKTGPFGSALHAEDYVLEGTPIITVEHLGDEGITRQNLPLVSDDDKKRLQAYVLKQGDIAFSRVGSVDRNAYVTDKEAGWLFSGRILRLRVRDTEVDPRYLGYHFKLEETKKRIRNVAVGQTMPSLNTQIMNAFPVALPPEKKEQEKIAVALSELEELIACLRQFIKKKQCLKIGTVQKLLSGRYRLPGFTREWEIISFEDCFDILSNNTLPRAELNEMSGIAQNIHYGDILIKYPWILDCETASIPFVNEGANINTSVLKDGDILFADTAEDETVGKATEIINIGEQRVVAGLHTIPCRPKKKDMFAPMWLGYYMNSSFFHDQLIPFITGIKVSSVSKGALSDTTIAVPEKAEQEQIVGILYEMDLEIDELQKKLNKYVCIKAGMMDELLTGKIRLV